MLKRAVRIGPHRALLLEALERAFAGLPRIRRALDLGCGEAPYRSLIEQASGDVVHYDIVRRPLVNVVGSAAALPFHDGSFDLVFSTQVLEHVANPTGVVGEVARTVAPGGWVVLSVPQMVALHEAPHDYFRYTKYGITHLLHVNGFLDVSVDALGGFWSMMAQQLEFRLLWDRGLRSRFLRRIELGIGRFFLAGLAALDGERPDTRYALNLVVVARRGRGGVREYTESAT